MNPSTIRLFLASFLAATTVADPSSAQNTKAEDTVWEKIPFTTGASPENAAGHTAELPSSVQPPAQRAHEVSAPTKNSTSKYDYGSAFERIVKERTGDDVPPALPVTEQKQESPEPSTSQPVPGENQELPRSTAPPPVTDEKQEPPGLETPRPDTNEKHDSPTPSTPQPPNDGTTQDEIAEDDEIELDGHVELLPLHNYLQQDHFEAVGELVRSMRTRLDMVVHNDLSEESKRITAKTGSPRSAIGNVFNSVLDNDNIGYFQPVQAERLQDLHLLGFADEELHKRRAELADSQGLPYVPKRWGTPASSGEVLKLRRGPLINHGFASATYAVRRIFPYSKDPGRIQPDKEGALKVYIAKRRTIKEDLAEEIVQHQCGVWKLLPPERSEELAEYSHLLYPVSVLKMLKDKTAASTRRRKKADAAPASENSAPREILSELLNGKILNLFVLYPRAYECTLKFLIVSRGRTELLIRIAPMKVMMSISIQMVYAVAQLNSYGIVHTRIRPTSFVITRDGKVLLTDLFSVVESGTQLRCFEQALPMALDINSSPEEAQCTERVPGNTYEATFALDSWRLGVALYKLWCRESWDPSVDANKWEEELERRRRLVQARTRDPYATAQRYNRHKLNLKHCRKDTPSFILRLLQQFLEPDPAVRLTAVDAVRGTSLFVHMKRRIQTAQAILENMKQQRRREEL